jgi:hypothetical protein
MNRVITVLEGEGQMVVGLMRLADGRNQLEITGDFSYEVDGMQVEGDSEEQGEEGGAYEDGQVQPLG